MLFDVTGKRNGDSIHFQIEVEDNPNDKDEMGIYRKAHIKAKENARAVFDFKGEGDDPTVSVKPSKEQGVE